LDLLVASASGLRRAGSWLAVLAVGLALTTAVFLALRASEDAQAAAAFDSKAADALRALEGGIALTVVRARPTGCARPERISTSPA
jgi:hypothetical protein